MLGAPATRPRTVLAHDMGLGPNEDLVVAMNALAPLMALLRLDRQRRDRAGFEQFQSPTPEKAEREGIRADSPAGNSITAPNWERGVQLSIFRSVAGELSNNVIQILLALRRDWSATVLALGARVAPRDPAPRLDGLCGASVVQLSAWLH